MTIEAQASLDDNIAALNDLLFAAAAVYQKVAILPTVAGENDVNKLAGIAAQLVVGDCNRLNACLVRVEHLLESRRVYVPIPSAERRYRSACHGAGALVLLLSVQFSIEAGSCDAEQLTSILRMQPANAEGLALAGKWLPQDNNSFAAALSKRWNEHGCPKWVHSLPDKEYCELCMDVHNEIEVAISQLERQSDGAEERGTSLADSGNTGNSLNKQVFFRMLNAYSDGLSETRFQSMRDVLQDDNLSANEKLMKIDRLVPIPPTASAQKLGQLIGVSKQAILKTDWWGLYRKREDRRKVEQRLRTLEERAKVSELPRLNDENG